MIRALFTKKGPAGAATLLTGLIVLIAAALMVLSFTTRAFTSGTMQQGEKAVKGEVVSIDNMGHLTVLTVRPNEAGFTNGQMHIYLNPYAKEKICKASEPAKDLKASRSATIKYHELGGLAVADSVSERC
jgi:hypothetical protein